MTRICWPFSWAHVASSDLGRLVLNKPETNPNPNCLVSPGTLFGPCWANVGSQGWNAWLFQFRLEAPNQSPCPSLDTWTRPPMCPSNMEGPTYRYGMASKSDTTDISGQHHSTVFFAWSLESRKCRRGSISRWSSVCIYVLGGGEGVHEHELQVLGRSQEGLRRGCRFA